MAFTQEKVRRTKIGNMTMEIHTCTFTGVTSGTLVTGLNSIESFAVGWSTTRASAAFDHTTTAGSIAMTGITAADVLTITVWGKN